MRQPYRAHALVPTIDGGARGAQSGLMAHAILILGAAMRPDGTPGPALTRRARHGAALWRDRQEGVIVATGTGGEAAAIAQICCDAGVPGDCILIEPHATNTAQNIAFCLPLLRMRSIAGVSLVTDGYHMPRASLIARRAGLAVTPAVAPVTGKRPHRHLWMILREAAACLLVLAASGRRRP